MRIKACLLLLTVTSTGFSQQVTVGTPLRGGSSGFYEHFGIGFGFQHVTPTSVMFFRHGGGAVSPFGGFDLSNANTFGLAGRHGSWSWNLNFSASQGSSYNNVSMTPSLTLLYGGVGYINDSVQRPFVTSFVPVVNGQTIEQRQAVVQHYADSAARYLKQHARQENRDSQELRKLRCMSKARLARSVAKSNYVDDAPLVLGKKGSPSGSD